MDNQLTPYEILQQMIEQKGLSRKDFARIVGRSYNGINKILNGQAPITCEMATLLSKSLDISYNDMKGLLIEQAVSKTEREFKQYYSNVQEEDELSYEINRRNLKLHLLYDISDLINKGYIRDSNNIEDLESDIMKFMGFSSVEQVYTEAIKDHNSQQRTLKQVIAKRKAEFGQQQFLDSIKKAASYQQINKFNYFEFKRLRFELIKREDFADYGWIHKLRHRLESLGICILFRLRYRNMPDYHSGYFWQEGRAFIIYPSGRQTVDQFLYAILHQLGHIYATSKSRDTHSDIRMCSFDTADEDQAKEKEADSFIDDILRSYEQIETAYKKAGHDVNKAALLLPDIPKPIVSGHFRWYRAHYRDRVFKDMPKVIDLIGNAALRQTNR